MSTGYECDLLPDLWNQILGWLKMGMAEDAIARARCRSVCKAWLARDPGFVVPLAAGLGAIVCLSAFDGHEEARAVFSRILAHLVPVLRDGFCLSRMYIWRGYHMQFILRSPDAHGMRLFADWWPPLKPGCRWYKDAQGRPRMFSTMDWKIDSAYTWEELGPCITRCITMYYSELWHYKKVEPNDPTILPRFHVSD
jgi:hypothetical protein